MSKKRKNGRSKYHPNEDLEFIYGIGKSTSTIISNDDADADKNTFIAIIITYIVVIIVLCYLLLS